MKENTQQLRENVGQSQQTRDIFANLYSPKSSLFRVDQESLIWLHTKQNGSARVMRWVLGLQEYDQQSVYIKGRSDISPDFVTRNPGRKDKSPVATTLDNLFADRDVLSNKNTSLYKDKDEFFAAMKEFLTKGKEPSQHFKHYFKEIKSLWNR